MIFTMRKYNRLRLHSDGWHSFKEFCWLAFCWLIIVLVALTFWIVAEPMMACLVFLADRSLDFFRAIGRAF